MAKTKEEKAHMASAESDAAFAELAKKLERAPEGWDTLSDDLVGFWDPERCGIYCIPRSVKLFDGSIDKRKPAILITVELGTDCIVLNSDGEPFIAPRGSMVGVWFKPGMKALRDVCGEAVYIKLTGEKDVGKGNPMKLFDVKVKEKPDKPQRIPVTDDTRDKSKHVRTVFDPPAVPTRNAPDVTDTDTDDIPF